MRTLTAATLFATFLSWLLFSFAAADVIVHFRDLKRTSSAEWSAVGVNITPKDRSVPVVSETANDPAYDLLRSLYGRGTANGFEGVLYDNRDREHSLLPPDLFPRLHHLKYGLDLQLENIDNGLADAILYPAIVFGNSSTAITAGSYARSLTRAAMTHSNLPRAISRLYRNNHLYVYPEHRDYDATDHYPANWPYHIISQGSSRSDQPFLRAIAATLAAFPNETLAHMREHNLVSPTLQMILRRNLAQVYNTEDYFDGAAHRPVLQSENLRAARMVAHAASLKPDDIQPMVQIEVIEEDFKRSAGLAQLSEVLYTTPSAVARIWRGFERTKKIIVSTKNTNTITNQPVTFSWHLLQGDPQKVEINPLDAAGQTALITISWHDSFEISIASKEGAQTRQTARVDIGVFASNGRGQSAPAILSVAFPAHQVRNYTNDGTDGLRLNRIDYFSEAEEKYFDPALYWSANWVDTAVYNPAGEHIAWRRVFTNTDREDMTIPEEVSSGAYTLVKRGKKRILEFTR